MAHRPLLQLIILQTWEPLARLLLSAVPNIFELMQGVIWWASNDALTLTECNDRVTRDFYVLPPRAFTVKWTSTLTIWFTVQDVTMLVSEPYESMITSIVIVHSMP